MDRVEEVGCGVLEVRIVPRRRSRPICSGCGRSRRGYDRLPHRRYRHLAFWGIEVELLYRPRQIKCPRCGIKVEQIPWALGKSPLTTPLVVVLSIGIDEITRRRGHRYMTNVYDLEGRRLMWTGVSRDEDSLRRFFEWWGKKGSNALAAVCCDMWRPYLKVIEEYAPSAAVVFDKFHVVRHLMEAVDEASIEEARLLAEAGVDLLKGTRYLWLKNPWRWTKREKQRFRELKRSNLKVYRAYLACLCWHGRQVKEAFRALCLKLPTNSCEEPINHSARIVILHLVLLYLVYLLRHPFYQYRGPNCMPSFTPSPGFPPSSE